VTGTVNCLDIGFKDKYEFVLYCGTTETGIYNPDKNLKLKTITTNEKSVTSVAISPECEYYVYCFGSDWCKGLEELNTYSAVKINVGRINTSDVNGSGGMGTSSYLR
jgi:hypothetical protein